MNPSVDSQMKLSEITKVSELFEILDTMEYYIFLNRLRENGATKDRKSTRLNSSH